MKHFPFNLSAWIIFFVAFAVRWFYNSVWMEHRIVHFGDAYNFLRSGTAILSTAASSSNLYDFIHKVLIPVNSSSQLLQSMTSMNLTDRLMIDGPVYPGYLAFIEWISGVNPFNPIFDSVSVKLCLCNSFIDSLACVLVYVCARLALNKPAAFLSGLLFALYPAAIINTQHCYSEPFSYFLLLAWTALVLLLMLRHRSKGIKQILAWFGLGLSSGLMMLSKPAFVMLPPLIAVEVIVLAYFYQKANKTYRPSFKQIILNISLALLGLGIILGPWIYFNKSVTGQFSIFVNRVPSFNIFHGNQLSTDGWRTYPYQGCFPGETKAVLESLKQDALKEPLSFVGLQFKKMARLWSGVWNEYHYSLFGISLEIQSLWHQILLLFGTLGLAILLFQSKHWRFSRSVPAAIVLGSIIIFHFAYLPFEAISRYAITAMPLVVIFASFSMLNILQRKQGAIKLCGLLSLSALAFCSLACTRQLSSMLAATSFSNNFDYCPWLAWVLSGSCFVLLLRPLFFIIKSSIAPNRLIYASSLLLSLAALTLTSSMFYAVQSEDWKEWHTLLAEPGTTIVQDIQLPLRPNNLANNSHCFVLIDMQSKILAPRIQVKVNGNFLSAKVIPLAQLMPDNEDILQCLAIQGEGMGRDSRSFRHWWIVPMCESSLSWNKKNTIEIKALDPTDKVRIFGNYCQTNPGSADGINYLPSLKSFSYTKGFTTFDHRDPRVQEKVAILGSTVSSSFNAQTNDLSEATGKQLGAYRVRLLLPCYRSAVAKQEKQKSISQNIDQEIAPKIEFGKPSESLEVRGNNPASFVPPGSPVTLRTALPSGSRFFFSSEIKSIKGNRPVFISLNFSGQDKQGKAIVWNSQWQPIGIPISTEEWRQTSFSDIIPQRILALSNLQVHVLFSPFQPDYLFLKKKQALKCAMLLRKTQLSFISPLILPEQKNRDWLLF